MPAARVPAVWPRQVRAVQAQPLLVRDQHQGGFQQPAQAVARWHTGLSALPTVLRDRRCPEKGLAGLFGEVNSAEDGAYGQHGRDYRPDRPMFCDTRHARGRCRAGCWHATAVTSRRGLRSSRMHADRWAVGL